MQIRPWEKLKEFLPPLSTTEEKALRESIETFGVKQPIFVLPDGRIIDGYHRWKISQGQAPYRVLSILEEQAFSLGIALNLARRQLSPEQIREIQEKLRKDKERIKAIALELRKQKKSQKEVAGLVGVHRSTISKWEKDTNDTSNVKIHNACSEDNNLDLRISIRRELYEDIYRRVKSGESQSRIAAEYKISQQRVSQIVQLVSQRERKPEPVSTPDFPQKLYRCIVIDPPWPVEKIEREERPFQGKSLDYPTMAI